MTDPNAAKVLKASILEAIRTDGKFAEELVRELFPYGLTVSLEDATDVYESSYTTLRVEVDLGYDNLRESAYTSFSKK